jgi:hypothetical protein
MKVDELIRQLRDIMLIHEEARDASVWLDVEDGSMGYRGQLKALGFDTKHKPPRIKLEA